MPPVFNQTNFYEQFIIYATIVEGLFVEVEGTIVFYFRIQHYVKKFVSDFRRVLCTSVSSTNKTDLHDITEILLKVAVNTITLVHSAVKPCYIWNKEKVFPLVTGS
jgi:hypothetical protein